MGSQSCSKCQCLNEGTMRENVGQFDREVRPIQFSQQHSESGKKRKQKFKSDRSSQNSQNKDLSTFLQHQQNTRSKLKNDGNDGNFIPTSSRVEDVEIQLKQLGVESRISKQNSILVIDPAAHLEKLNTVDNLQIKVPFSVIILIIKTPILKQFLQIEKDFESNYASPKSHSFHTWKLQQGGFYTNNLPDGTNLILTQKMLYKGWTKFQSFIPQNLGILIHEKGRYQGNFIEGKAHGKGTYQGYFQTVNSKGKQIPFSQRKFLKVSGKWERGQLKDGKIQCQKYQYEGPLRNSVPQGKGFLTVKPQGKTSSGFKYYGNFIDGEFSGAGKYQCDKYLYTGNFSRGKKNGYGVLIEKQNKNKQEKRSGVLKGEKLEGEWKDDVLSKQVKKI